MSSKFTCEYIRDRQADLVASNVCMILKIDSMLNINRLQDSMLVAAFVYELNYVFGSALIVPESFLEILAEKTPDEIMDAFTDDEKLSAMVEFVSEKLIELQM